MTWTGQTFTAGQILTAVQLNNLQADITAQANGDSGAPKNKLASMDTNSVDTSQIVAAAITQGKLSTTMSEVSTASAAALLTLPGGEYGFYPQVKTTSGSSHGARIAEGMSNTSYATYIYIDRASGSGTGYAQQRYIQASPPYDLGDGPIPLFVFLLIDNTTQDIISTYIAPEAPWHHNGPTIITADEYINGVPHRFVRNIPANIQAMYANVLLIREKLRDGLPVDSAAIAIMRNFYNAVKDEPLVLEEITQDIKNADMDLLPNPFPNADLVNQTIVLADPLSDITLKLLDFINDEGSAFETTKLFQNGFFNVDNTPLTRQGPPGVIQVGFDWS